MTRSTCTRMVSYAVFFLVQFLLTCDTYCPNLEPYGSGVQSPIEQDKADQCFPNPPCDPKNTYYSYNGSCNNLAFPTWGQAEQGFIRYLRANYSDGDSTMRKSSDGSDLPLCRTCRVKLLPNKEALLDKLLTIMFYGFGQMTDHDVAHQFPMDSSNTLNKNPSNVQCCVNGKPAPSQPARICCPMMISSDDYFYSKFNLTCIDMKCSVNTWSIGCNITPTCQINHQTAYFDLSFIYGISSDVVASFRTFVDGQLNTSRNAETNYQITFPMMSGDRACPAGGIKQGLGSQCFLSGDSRLNQNSELYCCCVIFLRCHNIIAQNLKKVNPKWGDEKLFQVTRRLMIAIFQRIIVNEYLPLLLGKDIMTRYNFTAESNGYKKGYNPFLNAGTLDIYSAVCGRSLHSQVVGRVAYMNSNNKRTYYNLKDVYFKLDLLLGKNMHYNMLKAYTSQTCQTQDMFCTEDLNDYLLRTDGMPYGLDVSTIDCIRGREWGIATYNDMRAACGLCRCKTFDDLAPFLTNPSDVDKFKSLYKHVDDIDLYMGCMAEKSLPGSIVGPTNACMFAESFKRWIFGDRYYHEFASANFTLAQLNSIRTAGTMANLICMSFPQFGVIQKTPFIVSSKKNPMLPCFALPQLNYSLWKE